MSGAEPNQSVFGRFQTQKEKAQEDSQSYEAASISGGLKSYAVAAILLSYSLGECINHSPTVHAVPVGKMHLSRGKREA